jgi:hypothetical protein
VWWHPSPPGRGRSPPLDYLVYGTGIFVIEVWIFATLALVFLAAMGVRLPRFSQAAPEPSRLELLSPVEFPQTALRVPLLLGGFGLLVGWAMTLAFKARGLPVAPAALVQLHSHTFFFILGYLMTLLAMRTVGVREEVFTLTYRLGLVGLPLLVVSWVVFNVFRLHSLVHVVPSLLYFAILFLGLGGLWGRFGLRAGADESFHYVRGALIFTWILLIGLAAVGPVIALGWDTRPDVTVTYKQPEGQPYPGPYPEKYIGTAPVARSPRGLENLHLSPGSWSHVAVAWLLTLMLFADPVGRGLGGFGPIFLAATTIPLAPWFNAVGRLAAWADLPAGIGALWFAGHPLKFFNTFLLGAVALVLIRRWRTTGGPADAYV